MLRHDVSLSRYLASTTKVPLKAFNESTGMYLAPMQVGQRTLHMSIDLFYGDVWVKCGELPQFDEEACQDFCPGTSSFRLQNDGNYCVTPVEEAYSISDLKIPNGILSIAQYSKEYGSPRSVLGLGTLTDDGDDAPLFKVIDSFSLSLASSDPFLLFGGVDQSLVDKEELTGYTVPVDKTIGWYMPFTALQLGDVAPQAACLQQEDVSCLAAVSARHNLIAVDSYVYRELEENYFLPANCIGVAEGSLCDASIASKLPRFTLVLGDKTFYLETEDYVQQSDTAGKVLVVLVESLGTNTWGLGLPFLRKYYSFYDNSNHQLTLYCKEGKTCADADSSKSGNKTGLYVGIACGVIALLVILFILRMVYRKKVAMREGNNVVKSTPIEGRARRLRTRRHRRHSLASHSHRHRQSRNSGALTDRIQWMATNKYRQLEDASGNN